MKEFEDLTVQVMVQRLALAACIGALIGYERRQQRKAIGVAGMVLVALGSATYMLLAEHLSHTDAAALSRSIQGLMQGIGFLGAAVIFRTGTSVKGIKTAAAIWITGAIGLAIGTWFWWLGILVGLATAGILLVTDLTSPPDRQRESGGGQGERNYGKAETAEDR